MARQLFQEGDILSADDLNEALARRRAASVVAGDGTKQEGQLWVPESRNFVARIDTEVGSGEYTAVLLVAKAGGTWDDDPRTLHVFENNLKTGIAVGTRVPCTNWDTQITFPWSI